jgi:isocitrate dehydrogenase kinase/phosphatase
MADTLGYSEAAFPRRLRKVPAPRNEEDAMDAAFWQGHKDRLQVGHVLDVFLYDRDKRFAQNSPVAAGTSPRSGLAGSAVGGTGNADGAGVLVIPFPRRRP